MYGFVYDSTGSTCSGRAQPGTVALAKWGKARWQLPMVGTYNCRPSRAGSSLSTHGEGRAVDLHVHTRASEAPPTAEERVKGDVIAAHFAVHAPALGVQRVIWLDREWDARPGQRDFNPYSGPFHGNHVHVELCWEAARHLTEAELAATVAAPQEDLDMQWLLSDPADPGGQVWLLANGTRTLLNAGQLAALADLDKAAGGRMFFPPEPHLADSRYQGKPVRLTPGDVIARFPEAS